MRLLAAVMIVACAWLSGQSALDRLRRRRELLEQMCRFIQLMCARITYALVPPERIIREMGEGDDGFFACCAGMLDEGMPLSCAWELAMQSCAETDCLRSEEYRLLSDLGGELGVYDAELQLSRLTDYAGRADTFRMRAEEEHREKKRLYTTCSLLAGTLISILII